MYGVTAGGTGLISLVTINLGTGLATVVAGIVDAATGAALDHIGSIEFADGVLYGGLSQNAIINPGYSAHLPQSRQVVCALIDLFHGFPVEAAQMAFQMPGHR